VPATVERQNAWTHVFTFQILRKLLSCIFENAVTHGISPNIAGGRILVVARRIDSKLGISIQDDGVGFDCRNSSPGNGGIGWENVRALRINRKEHVRCEY
jgi:sensor histidine kinase YesM